MNSVVGSSFKEKFVEIRTCRSREQCTGTQGTAQTQMHLYPNANAFVSKPTLS